MLESGEAEKLAEELHRQNGLVFCVAATAIVPALAETNESASIRVCHLERSVYLTLTVGGKEHIFVLGTDGAEQITTSLNYHRAEAAKC